MTTGQRRSEISAAPLLAMLAAPTIAAAVELSSRRDGCMVCLFMYLPSLSIQVCPKKGINLTIPLWGWDWDHQTYSREGYGSLGHYLPYIYTLYRIPLKVGRLHRHTFQCLSMIKWFYNHIYTVWWAFVVYMNILPY